MSWTDKKQELQLAAQTADKAAILMTKDNWFCKMLGGILTVISFGGVGYTKFMENFATTIGPLQFYPRAWLASQVDRVCVHEGEHTRHSVICGIVTWLAGCIAAGVLAGSNGPWWAGLITGGSMALFAAFPFLWRPPRVFMAFLGLPLMLVIYGMLPVPAGFAYFRYRMELAADRVSWRHMLRTGADDKWVLARAERFAKTVSSGSYLWSVPESMALAGFRKAAEAAIAEYRKAV